MSELIRNSGPRTSDPRSLEGHVAAPWLRQRALALIRRHGPPLLFYALLAVLLTWPLALSLTSAIPSPDRDQWQNLWNLWWLKRALVEGHNPYYTTAVYYPGGASLLLHTLNPLNFVISLPVHALFGLIAAYNAVVLFSLTLTGFATYLLAYDQTRHRGAALIGGVIFATSGYVLSQVVGGIMQLMSPGWIVLSLLAMRRAVAEPSRARTLLAALALAILVFLDWYYFIFTCLWHAWYLLALLWRRRDPRLVRPIVVAGALAALAVSPLALATARLAEQTPNVQAQGDLAFQVQHSVDLADLLIPNQLHPLWGEQAARAQSYKDDTDLQNKTIYLGAAALALAIVAVRRRQGRLWLGTALIFALLALGPRLRLFGLVTSIPLPESMLQQLPLLSIARYPFRYISVAMLGLSVLAALGARQLLASAARSWRYAQHALVAALIGLILLDQRMPIVPQELMTPVSYQWLAQQPGQGAVLPAPMSQRYSSIFMFYQATHGKPLVGGYLSRDLSYPLLERFPLIRWFAQASPVVDIIDQDPREIAPSLLSYFKIEYVLIDGHTGALRNSDLLAIALAASGGRQPLVSSEAPLLLYQVQPPARMLPFLGLGAGWAPPQMPGPDQARRLIDGQAELLLYNPERDQLALTLQLESPSAGLLELEVDGALQPALSLQPGAQQLRIVLPTTGQEAQLLLRPRLVGSLAVARVALERLPTP